MRNAMRVTVEMGDGTVTDQLAAVGAVVKGSALYRVLPAKACPAFSEVLAGIGAIRNTEVPVANGAAGKVMAVAGRSPVLHACIE